MTATEKVADISSVRDDDYLSSESHLFPSDGAL